MEGIKNMKKLPGFILPILVVLAMLLPVLPAGILGVMGEASAQAAPPEITTGAASGIKPTYCVLGETLTTLGDFTPVYISFRYGETTEYEIGNTSENPKTSTGSNYIAITGLTPSTLYHYQAVARYDTTSYAYGLDGNLTTTTVGSPTVTTGVATVLSSTSASLSGTFVLNNFSPVYAFFQYGTTTSYTSGNTTEYPYSTNGTLMPTLWNVLTPSTLYHFRIAVRYDTNIYVWGDDGNFTTSAANDPVAITGGASFITATTATLQGTLTSLGNFTPVYVYFEYGLAESYGTTTAEQTKTSTGGISQAISSLTPGALYYFRITVRYNDSSYFYGAGSGFRAKASVTPTPTPASCAWGVNTLPTTNITPISATLTAELCNTSALDWYFWVSSDLEVTYIQHVVGTGLLAGGTFSLELTNLEPDSLYYYWASIRTGEFLDFASWPRDVFMTLQPDYIGNETIGNNTGFVPVLPDEPGGWVRPPKDWGDFGGIPWTFITYILVTAFMVFTGLMLSKYIRKLAVMVIVLGFILGVLCFWPKGGYLDWWILFPYVLVAWALLHRQSESPIEE